MALGDFLFRAFHAMKNTHWCLLLAPLLALGSVAVAADLPSFPYSMPAVGPAYPPPPWRYRDCRLLVLTLRSDPEVVKRLVPPPLVPNADGVVMMWLGDMHAVDPFELDYLEYGLGVPVEHDGKRGIYCAHLYLDDDTAIAGGREIWGWPKKLAAIAFTVEGNRVTATATRKGVEIIRAEFEGGSDLPIEDLPQHFINFKIIPSVRADAPPDVCQLNDCPFLRVTRSQKAGKATLALRSSAVDALGDLPVHEILQARFSIADVELPLGETIHDYLAEPGSDDAETR